MTCPCYRWIGGRYNGPVEDTIGQLSNTVVSYVDGKINFQFTRKRTKPAGSLGHSFGDDDSECFYMMFPVGGGSVMGSAIAKHDARPEISASKICIRSCDIAVQPTPSDSGMGNTP